MDMGIGDRRVNNQYVPVEVLEPGFEIKFHDHKFTVKHIDEKEMVFTYYGMKLILNREWQLLGSPEIGCGNAHTSAQERFVFYFSTNPEDEYEWDQDAIESLYERMCENDRQGKRWKNIPLGRQLIHHLKDLCPYRYKEMNPSFRAYIISKVLKNDLLEHKETVRLFASYCEFFRLSLDFYNFKINDEKLPEDFDKDYFRSVDSKIYYLSWILNGNMSKYAIECWDSLGSFLKTDPVQSTKEYEDIIYEVELEVEQELKDMARGMGFCFAYWSAKKAALARRSIKWKSPSAMNPSVLFD